MNIKADKMTVETLLELLSLVLGVAMHCEHSQEVITQITEMDEAVVNELQTVYEYVIETYLNGANHLLDSSKERINSSMNLSGLFKSNSLLKKNVSQSRINENDASDFESESDNSFNGGKQTNSVFHKNRKRTDSAIMFNISKADLSRLDLERNRYHSMIAKLEDEVNSLKASNEELQAQIDSKEVKIHGFENDVEQLRSSLVMNTGAAAEL